MTEPITRGDRYDIPFKVNGDLTGFATTLRFRLGRDAAVTVPHTITTAAEGEGVITDSSALPVGGFRAELEAVLGDPENPTQRVTYPVKGFVTVAPDLG